MRKSSAGPPTQEQPQHWKSSSSEARRASCPLNTTPTVSSLPTSLQITHERNPVSNGQPSDLMGADSKQTHIPEDDVDAGSTDSGYHVKFASPHSSSEGVASLELERKLSILFAAQTESDRCSVQLTDWFALKSALFEQADVDTVGSARRAAGLLCKHTDD